MLVKIKKNIFEQIILHARDEAPLECCGLLTGQNDTISNIRRMKNILNSQVRYAMDPKALFDFFRDLRISGQNHLGIYHSHPSSKPYPSETDVRESFYPDCPYFIVSLRNPQLPQVRAFQILHSVVQKLEIRAID